MLGTSYDRELTGEGDFLTVHYIPYIGDDRYTRVGLLFGAGTMDYELTQSGGDLERTFSTDGSARLFQAYVDWGGEAFGARFGLGHPATDLDPMDTPGGPLDADASGNHVFLDLRWAFE